MLTLTHVSRNADACQRHTDVHKHRKTNHLVTFTQSDLIVKMLLWYGLRLTRVENINRKGRDEFVSDCVHEKL